MSENRSDFVIVGGVACGPKAASVLARRLPDAKITLFQREELASYATCGMPYFASGDIEAFEKLTGFELITGAEVIRIDRKSKRVEVRMIASGELGEHSYGKLVLATGGRPGDPPFPVADSPMIRSFTKPDDAIAFRKAAQTGQIGKAVVIGGGFIGCEVVESAAVLWGIETTLVEKESQILPFALDPEMAAIAEREMKRQGVEVLTGAEVESVELDGEGKPVVKIVDRESITCDFVFICLGVRPAVDLARECELDIGKYGGILVDSRMMTSDLNIFAGGDCVECFNSITQCNMYLPMGSLANRHGRVIGENLAGNEAEFKGVVGAFFVKIFDVNVGAVGLTEKVADRAGLRSDAVLGSFPDKPDYYPEYQTFTLKMRYSSDDLKLLGLQAVGAGDIFRRIDVFSSFLQRQGTLTDLLDFEHGYAPPYSEALDPLYQLASFAIARNRGLSVVSPYVRDEGIILDVREVDEIESEPWPTGPNQELINIPLGELRSRHGELDKGKKIIIACRRGPRSYQAGLILKHAGFDDVHVIGGGAQALR
jgi:NADPH-dependent 2,4-dienoyl-CoA reductase/sulfur reductase-like enzyme/rhodanese-related sulfurtransferase